MKHFLTIATLALTGASSAALAGTPFRQTFELQGIAFEVSATNDGSINQLKITPTGLADDNAAVEAEIDGSVTGAEVADLDSNGFPEIYVYVSSAGSGTYGSLVAYAVNNGKSMTPIYLPPLDEDSANSAGYMGHDEFAALEGVLGRRFPLYATGDDNADPTGKTRQLQYKLVAGEAGWVLELASVDEF